MTTGKSHAGLILSAIAASTRVLAYGVVLLALGYLATGISIIGPNEAGLIFRWGKLLPQVRSSGLLWAFPPPIDHVIKIPVKSVREISLDLWAPRSGDTPRNTLNPVTDGYTLTSDANIVQARFVVRYGISDPRSYELATSDQESLLNAILYQAAAHVLAETSVDDALTTRRDAVGQDAMRLAQIELDRLGLGITLSAFEARELEPPSEVRASFQAVISAKVGAQTVIEEARSYAAGLLPVAHAEADGLRVKAAADAKGTVSEAQGKTASFLAQLEEYRRQPELYRARLQAETVTAIMPKLQFSTIIPGHPKILLSPPSGPAEGEHSDER